MNTTPNTPHDTVDQYAVFGNPIAHSKSPQLHAAFAKATQQNIQYTAECVAPDRFTQSANNFFQRGGKGLNITVPFKLDAFNYAHQLSERARRAGAVNTLSIDSAGVVTGDNTDGIGMVTDITQNLDWSIKNKRVLLVGAGGAVRGVIGPLLSEHPASITLVNRTSAKAQQLADDFADLFVINACGFDELTAEPFDLIINGTSASLSGDLPPLSPSIIQPNSCCYDMMYSKTLTPFLVWCQNQGAQQLSDGLGMLVCQGAESFFIWRGLHPQTQPVIQLLRKAL